MCFVVQLALFMGASLITWLLCHGLHAPLWAGGVGAGVFFVAAWIAYLRYQSAHLDFWCPWDEGLPRAMRMGNAFLPAIGVFCMIIFLMPTFRAAREKALAKRQHTEARRERGVTVPHARSR